MLARALSILVASFIASGLSGAITLAAERECQVGIIAPVSGAAAMYGRALQRGVELFNADSPSSALRFRFEDNRGTPGESVSAYRRLTQNSSSQALIVLHSGPASAVAPLAERDQTPLFVIASDERIATSRQFVRRVWPGARKEGRMIADHAYSSGYRRVLFLAAEDEYAESVGAAFQASFQGSTRLERVPAVTHDLRSLLSRMKNRASNDRFDAVGLCLRAGQVGVAARQLRELGWEQPIFGCVTLDGKAELAAAAGALDGAWYLSAGISEQFRESYQRRFRDQDFIGGAALIHDLAIRLEASCQSRNFNQSFIDQVLTQPQQPRALTNFLPESGAVPLAIVPSLEIQRHISPPTTAPLSSGSIPE
jgi:ABC-type branched-subunit amino acid transport system substrate-binding protein